MSIHRTAAKRDANEPIIRKRFSAHGWHTEQVSGTGMPDLLVFNLAPLFQKGVRLVDVKMPKGTLKPAQVKKWTTLHALGIPVYVVRTEADVDALVGGTLAPWEPPTANARWRKPCGCLLRDNPCEHDRLRAKGKPATPHSCKNCEGIQTETCLANPHRRAPRKGDAAKAREDGLKRPGMGHAIHTQEERRCERCKKVIPEWRAGMCLDCDNHYTPPRSTPVDAAKEAEAFAAPETQCGCRLGVLCSHHKRQP